MVGIVLLPVIHYSVTWWNSLHQGQTISLFGESKMDPGMLPPLWWMVLGTHVWFAGSLLARARADNLRREAGKDWRRRPRGRIVSYRNYVIAAYAVFAAMLLWDYLAPKLQLSQALRAIRLQYRRDAAGRNPGAGMNPTRRRRLLLVLLAVILAGIAIALTAVRPAAQRRLPLHPREVLNGEAGAGVRDAARASASAAWSRPAASSAKPVRWKRASTSTTATRNCRSSTPASSPTCSARTRR